VLVSLAGLWMAAGGGQAGRAAAAYRIPTPEMWAHELDEMNRRLTQMNVKFRGSQFHCHEFSLSKPHKDCCESSFSPS
jgi:hypothetical protein